MLSIFLGFAIDFLSSHLAKNSESRSSRQGISFATRRPGPLGQSPDVRLVRLGRSNPTAGRSFSSRLRERCSLRVLER